MPAYRFSFIAVPFRKRGYKMSEQLDPNLKKLANWLIGGLIVIFILSIVLF